MKNWMVVLLVMMSGVGVAQVKDSILRVKPMQDTIVIISPKDIKRFDRPWSFGDSLLPYVTVVSFRELRMARDVGAAVTAIDRKFLQSTDRTSLQTAMNSIPGVFMESRGAGGSHRISIRGSALRAPFAVRNVKMYVNGIPFTSPDGQSPLEIIDAGDLQSFEVLRGPSGAMWGSGNGGVLQFNLLGAGINANDRFSVRSEAQVGSFGQYRLNNVIKTSTQNLAIRFSQTNQSVDGYRQQEFNRKSSSLLYVEGSWKWHHRLEVFAMYYSGNWGLPGGLNKTQRDDKRTNAIPFSVDNNASVWRDRYMMGAKYVYMSNKNWSWSTSVNGYTTDKTNPYGTSPARNGFKTEQASGGGARTEWNKFFESKKFNGSRFIAGAELQLEHYFIDESSNAFGQPGEFKYSYDVNYANYNIFALLDWRILPRLTLQAGGSVMQEHQTVKGYTVDAWRTDTTHTGDWAVLPRAAITYKFKENWNLFASVGLGNSTPSVFEMVDYENNRYNLALQPERGINREAGLKWGDPGTERSFEVNVYCTTIQDIILSEVRRVPDPANDSLQIEVEQFANRGETDQRGLEMSAQWVKYFDSKRLRVSWQTSGSWNWYRFVSFVVSDINYASRRVPGIPEVQFFNHLRLEYRRNYNVGVMAQYTGPIDLNYSNSVRSTDYTIVNVYAGAEKALGKSFVVGLRAGINNATDTRYSGFFNYNDFGGRFYNPALPINYFALVSLEYRLTK